jgi:hypothetical protein
MHFVSLKDQISVSISILRWCCTQNALQVSRAFFPTAWHLCGAFGFRSTGINKFYSPFHSSELLGVSVLKVGVRGSPEIALSSTWTLLKWLNLCFCFLTVNILLNCVVACADQLVPSRVNEIWWWYINTARNCLEGSWGTLPGYVPDSI